MSSNQVSRIRIAQLPTSFGSQLRACLGCRLLKTYDQFRDSGCENCTCIRMENDHDRLVECTTPNFTGIISIVKDPTRSWAARWIRIDGRNVPGCYTLAISQDLKNICEEEDHARYIVPRKRVRLASY